MRSPFATAAVVVGVLATLLTGCVVAARPHKRHAARARPAIDPQVRAELEQVTPAYASALALLSFHNTTGRTVRVLRFRIRWSAGELLVIPPDLTIQAGARLEAPLRIGPEAGDLDALYASPLGTRVEILAVASL